MPTAEIQALTIVVIGNFNPMIFHPAWFRSAGLIDEDQQADATKGKVVLVPEFAQVTLSHITLEATANKLIAFTLHPGHFEVLRDFVIDLFRVLPHTPVNKIAINLEEHWKFENEEVWNEFGHKLAPKGIWKKFMKDPGLSVIGVQDKAERGKSRIFRVEVSASPRIKPWGIFFQTNDEQELKTLEGEPAKSGADLVKLMSQSYPESVRRGKSAIEILLNES